MTGGNAERIKNCIGNWFSAQIRCFIVGLGGVQTKKGW
jgi:hypothetical protein